MTELFTTPGGLAYRNPLQTKGLPDLGFLNSSPPTPFLGLLLFRDHVLLVARESHDMPFSVKSSDRSRPRKLLCRSQLSRIGEILVVKSSG